ncbi:hypothetical protein M407DRAFT_29562 [Tulasnella calospora MUT 4182]|uniref:Uncharacterized protein n=1 Tax=Tulasnella calospora MUT 4182 TaxID=1051891 RepID=A0A0C3LH91_9AGAM|nr:hypothetical protein M407DRAFT_29562 [Tulasnella calospora MUT 4182]
MKFLAIILIVLAYWPLTLDCYLSGQYALSPTHVFPRKTYSTGDAFKMDTAALRVLPTPRIAYHNNAGQSAHWFDSTISTWTGLPVSPDCGLSGIGYASFNLTHRQLQTAWSFVRHWWRNGPVRFFEATISFTIYLLFSLAVGIALLPKYNVEQHVVVAHPQRKLAFVEGITSTGGSSKGDTHELGIRTQPPVNIFTLEGRLVVFSEPATSNGPIDWTVLFHPCQYYHPAESSNRPAQLGVADERLLHMLLRGVSAYHPWSWYRPSIFVDLPGEVVKEFHAGRGHTFVARIAGVRVVPKRTAHEQTIQRRVVRTLSMHRLERVN